MKKLVGMKVILLVLALTFAVPRPALATGEFEPFTDLVEDLADALDQVIEEIDDAVEEFGEDSKISKNLLKGQADLAKARTYIALDVKKKDKDPTEFPKNLKKVVKSIKKWGKKADKSAKAGAEKLPCGTLILNARLNSYLNSWTVLLVVALVALINMSMTHSLLYQAQFTKALEKKHVKCKAKHDAAMVAFGMAGTEFVPVSFFFALKGSKKGLGLLLSSLTLSIVLMSFIKTMQSQG